MNIKKIRVAAFAIKNRLLVYHLLQNTKGSSPYQIKMIKTWSGISPELDRFDHYHTKYRDFSKPDEKTVKQTLLVTRYTFWKDKNNKKIVKEVLFNKRKSNGDFISKVKESGLGYDEIINRDTSYIDTVHKKGYHKEFNPSFIFLGYAAECSVPTMESIADKEISSFFKQKHKDNIQRKTKSFWTILRKNLTNK